MHTKPLLTLCMLSMCGALLWGGVGCSSAPAKPKPLKIQANPHLTTFTGHARWMSHETLMVLTLDVQQALDLYWSTYTAGHVDQTKAKALRDQTRQSAYAMAKDKLGVDMTKLGRITIGIGNRHISVVVTGANISSVVKPIKKVGNYDVYPIPGIAGEGASSPFHGIQVEDNTMVYVYPHKRLEQLVNDKNANLAAKPERLKAYLAALPKAKSIGGMALVADNDRMKRLTREVLSSQHAASALNVSVDRQRIQFNVMGTDEALFHIKNSLLQQFDRMQGALAKEEQTAQKEDLLSALFINASLNAADSHRVLANPKKGQGVLTYELSLAHLPALVGGAMNIFMTQFTKNHLRNQRWRKRYNERMKGK